MEFNIYAKDKSLYKRIAIVVPNNADWAYFKSLQLTIDTEILNMQNDIISFFNNKDDVNLIAPKIDNYDQQKRINKLVEMKKCNRAIKDEIDNLMSADKFILCDCGKRMYKVPVNVSYERIGNRYMLKNINPHEKIRYVYMCEECFRAIGEESYLELQKHQQLRDKLIAEGESYLPDAFGFWKWENSKKSTKPKMVQDDDQECDHSWRRNFESIKLDTERSAFIKITEVCVKCNKINHIK